MALIACSHVANYFLSRVDEEAGDLISNLKLQKLLYYAQGFHLAIFDTPLFTNDIQAWKHGPVVESLYHTYKDHGSGGIPPLKEMDTDIFSDEVIELLDEIHNMYGQYGAWKLRNMTHEEPPWKSTYKDGVGSGRVIPLEAMQNYFKTQLQ